MSVTKRYTLNELRALMEEKSEFKPRLGDGVESNDKKNNKDGVKKMMDDAEKASGRNTKKNDGKKIDDNVNDYNKTPLDANFDRDPGEEYKERVKQLAVYGTPHKLTKDEKDPEKNGGYDYENPKSIFKSQAKKNKEMSDTEQELKAAGLKAREENKDKFKNNTLFKESKAMKRLHFKNTRFLSEAQLIKKVPESYKTDGNRFYMRDNTGTDYLVECHVDDEFNHTTINVLNKINKTELNEQLNRMRNLSNYESGNYFSGTSAESRKAENNVVGEMLDIVKRMENTKK